MLPPAHSCLYTKGCGLRFTKRALAEFVMKCPCEACRTATRAALANEPPERPELQDRFCLLTTGAAP